MTSHTQSAGEEIANSVSHGIALLAVIAATWSLMASDHYKTPASFVGAMVFAGTMVCLYLTSTIYHALPIGRAKQMLLKLDYGAIFSFIAGSYTPFALSSRDEVPDWALLGAVWLMAIFGMALKISNRLRQPWLSTVLYVLMGWAVLMAALPLVDHLPVASMTWLVAGGIAYTVGTLFFMVDARVRYAHAVWHGFVAVGTGCHYWAVRSLAA
ncbi:PAQR family membrane homeostasis protein TrhA [Polaromonas glacialis]|uniref:PAQR family membrane homeostasis protein TrhA n=1 Tax=Polaromonas glacialis TaxID=866564 RepID=UPI00049596E7|nr:hemolysin III family protein [Polaromonas glacialis]